MDKRIIQSKSKLQIGLPSKTLSPSAISDLKQACKSNSNLIDRCFLFMKGVEQQEAPLLTVGVLFSQFDKNNVNTVMQSIVSSLQKHLTEEDQLDLMILNNQTNLVEYLENLKGATIFN